MTEFAMKILFVTNGDNADPSSRVRIHQFLPDFRRELGTMNTISLGSASKTIIRMKQTAALVRAKVSDAVVIQKVASAKLVRAFARLNPRLIYDVDDGVFVDYPSFNSVLHLFERVVVGNDVLASHVRGFNPNVEIIPSVVDEHRFQLTARDDAGRSADQPLTIGWVGHSSNLRYLEPLRGAFASLARRFPGRFVLRIVSSEPLRWGADVPVENKSWRLDEEAADVRGFDIGLMPLDDDEWSRAKCGYKAILYMSQSLPVVVSPVGANAEIVTDGVDGFHATDPATWELHLARLITDGTLRRSLGDAARAKVERRYTINAVMPQWLQVLKGREVL
jgi:glycosyltransferase involved in cell wall biosynthesis